MTRFFSRFAGFIMAGILLLTVAQKASAQDVMVSYQTFYDELSPYGQWVYDAEYGNVWVPNEEAGYRPYASRGHWAMTEYGNMWVSDVPWGWACYHYGRWTYNPFYGWVWVPGYEWAPAWVSWRAGGGYYGWAPMGPGYMAGNYYDYPESYWVFVGPQYLYQPNVYSYYEPRHAGRYIRRTTYITETYIDNSTHITYNYGPRREMIERETHQPVQVYRVSESRTPMQTNVRGNEVNVYRPAVNRNTMATARPANVIRAAEPVGRPQQISRNDNYRQPEFRQIMQRDNPALRNNGATNNTRQPDRFDNRAGMGGRETQPTRQFDRPDQNNRAQPGRFDNRSGVSGAETQPARQFNQPDQNRPQPGRFDNRSGVGGAETQPTRQFNQADQNNRPQPGRFEQGRPQENQQQEQGRPQRGGFWGRTQENQQPARQQTNQPEEQSRPQRGGFWNRPQENQQPTRQQFNNAPQQQQQSPFRGQPQTQQQPQQSPFRPQPQQQQQSTGRPQQQQQKQEEHGPARRR